MTKEELMKQFVVLESCNAVLKDTSLSFDQIMRVKEERALAANIIAAHIDLERAKINQIENALHEMTS